MEQRGNRHRLQQLLSGILADSDRSCDVCQSDNWNRLPQLLVEDLADSDRNCGICQEEYKSKVVSSAESGEFPLQLPCGHIFGDFCLHRWLEEKNTCPLCRKAILDSHDLHDDDSDISARYYDHDFENGSSEDEDLEDRVRDPMDDFYQCPRDQLAYIQRAREHRRNLKAQLRAFMNGRQLPEQTTSFWSAEYIRIIRGETPAGSDRTQEEVISSRASHIINMAQRFNLDIASIHPNEPLDSEIRLLNEIPPATSGQVATELECMLFSKLEAGGCFSGRAFRLLQRKRRVSLFRIFAEMMAAGVYWDQRHHEVGWLSSTGGPFFPAEYGQEYG